MIDKKIIRTQVRDKKKLLTACDIEAMSDAIFDRLYAVEEYNNSDDIYTYVNYNQEVNTIKMIQHCLQYGKNVHVPYVDGEDMYFYDIESINQLIQGSYNIPEPDINVCRKDVKNTGIMIMPGLAFDRDFRRIGYGGGFYDRYLSKYPDYYKIALCYDFQLYDELIVEEHDISVDMIITPHITIRRSC